MNKQNALNLVYASNISSSACQIICYLIARSNKEGTCFPSIKTIANDTKLSLRTVQRNLRKLEELNYIRCEARTAEYGRKTSNLYTISIEENFTNNTSLHDCETIFENDFPLEIIEMKNDQENNVKYNGEDISYIQKKIVDLSSSMGITNAIHYVLPFISQSNSMLLQKLFNDNNKIYPHSCISTLLYLSIFSNNGEINCRIKDIAEKSYLSNRTVHRAINHLINQKYILRESNDNLRTTNNKKGNTFKLIYEPDMIFNPP